jgi:hypothetical protein
VQRHVGGGVKGTGQTALYKAVEPIGQPILIFAAEIAAEHAIEIAQQRDLLPMCAGVCCDANLAIGLIQRPVQQAFLACRERGDATGSPVGQHDVEEGMQRLYFLGQPIPSAAILQVGSEVGARGQQIEGVQMLLGAGSQPHKVSTERTTQILVFLLWIDDEHLQAARAMQQEFAHDADLIEIGFACTRNGATKFMRVVQCLSPLVLDKLKGSLPHIWGTLPVCS